VGVVLGGLQLIEERVEAEEVALPVSTEPLRPFRGVLERGRVEAAQVLAAADTPPDKPGALEHTDVLGRGREGHPERGRELAEILLTIGESAENGAPGRVRQGVEDAVERGVPI
jgi:hypothetical protein